MAGLWALCPWCSLVTPGDRSMGLTHSSPSASSSSRTSDNSSESLGGGGIDSMDSPGNCPEHPGRPCREAGKPPCGRAQPQATKLR